MSHVHFKPMKCITERSRGSHVKVKGPVDGKQSLRIQTRHASASGVCDGWGVADTGTVCVLSGPARVKLYLTSSSVHNVNANTHGRELIQFGYLKFEMPTGSAVVVGVQIAGSSSGVFQQEMRDTKRKLIEGKVWY